ncbi:oxidoreductase [Bacillus salitolerans]|uniref:Oxidoreductase n=1 Tax=Bacillus salitolerans TaxID=1437434 RepID=A0ABW4LP87_9BACI
MAKINVGLVGYGLSGQTFHAPLLTVLNDFEIVKVVSSKIDKVKQDLGEIEVVSRLEDILADSQIHLIVITTPSGLHYEMAKQSLLAGKHVILEKPMVVRVSEGEELIKIANERNLLLSVYHNRRWDNDYVTIKNLINEGVLGEINTYQAHFDRYRPVVRDRWKENEGPGSGSLYDLGSHLIDQALHLFGEPHFVWADVFGQRTHAKTDDYFHIVLGYRDNLRVILHSGAVVLNAGPRFQVHGSRGSFIKYGIDGQEDALKAGLKPIDSTWGADNPEFYGKLVIVKEEQEEHTVVPTLKGSYLTYYKDIARSLLQGVKLPVTAEDGLTVIKIIDAALKSSIEKSVVYMD